MERLFDNPKTSGPHPIADGIQRIYEFDNGFGASVIQLWVMGNPASYGADDNLWELAVLGDGLIRYDTTIISDVIGRLTEDEVEVILHAIKNLPSE